MAPKLIEGLDQSGDAWHKFRLEHIGSSDVPQILLCDPFGGPTQDFQLYLEKSGKKKADSSGGTEATNHGKDSEETARNSYMFESGNLMAPAVVECTREGFEYLACSLDGGTSDLKLIAELKCPIEAGTFREAKEGQIPPNYYAQMQHQLFVTEAERCDYYCWFRGEGILIPVMPDVEFLESVMLPAVVEFWKRVQAKTWPLPAGEITLESPEYLKWATKMADLIEMEREVKNAKQTHMTLGANKFWNNSVKICGGGLEITRQFKKGSTSTPKARTVSDSIATTIRRIE